MSQFRNSTGSNTSGITLSRYIRLLCLSTIVVLWETGENIYLLWYNISKGVEPYLNWEDLHFNFSRVARFPRFLLMDDVYHALVTALWIPPTGAIAFCLCFVHGGGKREGLSTTV